MSPRVSAHRWKPNVLFCTLFPGLPGRMWWLGWQLTPWDGREISFTCKMRPQNCSVWLWEAVLLTILWKRKDPSNRYRILLSRPLNSNYMLSVAVTWAVYHCLWQTPRMLCAHCRPLLFSYPGREKSGDGFFDIPGETCLLDHRHPPDFPHVPVHWGISLTLYQHVSWNSKC